MPGMLLWDAIDCLAGGRTGVKAMHLTRQGIIAIGLLELGFAIAAHAYFSEWYEGRLPVRNHLIVLGVCLIILSLGYSVMTSAR